MIQIVHRDSKERDANLLCTS